MIVYHKDLTQQKWNQFSIFEQMANIGSDVFRAIKWKNKGEERSSRLAFERALELIDLTVEDPKNLKRLGEILRVRECLTDYFVGDNIYKSSESLWQNYFYQFNWAARLGV